MKKIKLEDINLKEFSKLLKTKNSDDVEEALAVYLQGDADDMSSKEWLELVGDVKYALSFQLHELF